MTTPHSITILETRDIFAYLRSGLATMASPFPLSLTVRKERRDVVKRIPSRKGYIEMTSVEIVPVEEERTVHLPHLADTSISLARTIAEALISETLNSLSAFLPTYQATAEIASLLCDVPPMEVTENQLAIAEYFLSLDDVEKALLDIQLRLSEVSRQPYRDWSLLKQHDVIALCGGRDHRITQWEEMTGNRQEENEERIDLHHVLSYLETHFSGYSPLKGKALSAAVRQSLCTALRYEIRYGKVESTDPHPAVDVADYRVAHDRLTLPLVQTLFRQTLSHLLTTPLSTTTTLTLDGHELVVVHTTNPSRYESEREVLQEEIDNQDYIPERMRRHYHV